MPGKIVSQEEWLTARKALLIKEKEHTRASDAINKDRQDLPMVAVTKSYTFTGPNGPVTLSDLFEGRSQLVIYHYMFSPTSAKGCPSCAFLGDHVPHLAHLNSRNTTFAMVSRAPYATIAAFKERMGWTMPWYSSFESDFNFDFHVSHDEAVAPIEYNFKTKEEMQKAGVPVNPGELPGMSIFIKEGDQICHSYSAYGRGLDKLLGTYVMLDLTPLGRQDGTGSDGLGWEFHDEY